MGEYLREESPNKHRLKSRLSWEWEARLKILVEPAQAVSSTFPSLYESAMLVVSYYLIYSTSPSCGVILATRLVLLGLPLAL